jgi:hypothetical protein
MMQRVRSGLLLLSAALLLPIGLAAQQQTQPQPAQQQAAAGQQQAPTELVFEREVFTYPSFQRRNPFRPLVAGEGGPRFEQLRVMGILYDPNPAASVAVLGTSTVTVSETGQDVSVSEGRSWYLKVGQSIGNVRILEIRRDQVVVEVEEFGLTEQKIMQLETRRLGGTP